MTSPIQAALLDLCVLRGSPQIRSLHELLTAMEAHYKDALLDAKGERVIELQASCKQVMQLRKAIADPEKQSPTI